MMSTVLHDLRRSMAIKLHGIIPCLPRLLGLTFTQERTLFSGTLHRNLDPHDLFTGGETHRVIGQVHLI